MKLCIATHTNEGPNAPAHEHFGSAPYFAVHTPATGGWESIQNINAEHAHGSCQPMAALAGRGIGAVVCGGMGARAVQKLNAQGVRVFRARPGTAAEMAAQYLAGRLPELTVADACAGHGHDH